MLFLKSDDEIGRLLSKLINKFINLGGIWKFISSCILKYFLLYNVINNIFLIF